MKKLVKIIFVLVLVFFEIGCTMDRKVKKVMCHDINECETEVSVDKLTFRPSVYGILIEDGKILLSKQWDGYDFPGGGVEIYETIDQALKREFFEETGLKVELVCPIFCCTSFFHSNYSKTREERYCNCPLIYFLVRKVGGELSKDNLDEDELIYADMPEWVSIDDAHNVKFYNSVDSLKVIKIASGKK